MLPDEKLSMRRLDWCELVAGLHDRTRGCHESGAFLLGTVANGRRCVRRAIYYDTLDSNAYSTGICTLHADSFAALWAICREVTLSVVADVHVHPRRAWQSLSDRTNPMIARKGHLAMILPDFARPPIQAEEIGLYCYCGSHRWQSLGGRRIHRHFTLEE